MKDTPLNIINMPDVTDWVKSITWANTAARISYQELKNKHFVSNNANAVAQMMAHAYIKRHITYYMNELIDTPCLSHPAPDLQLSDSVIAACNAGYPAYVFALQHIPDEFANKIERLNSFLVAEAHKYIMHQIATSSNEFLFDIQYLNKQFSDYRSALTKAKWAFKTPSKQANIDQKLFKNIILEDYTK